MFLHPADVHVLTEKEPICPVVVKTNSFPTISKQVSQEIADFSERRSDLFVETKVGRNENTAFAPDFRGDLRCWLTPKICSDEKLTATSALVKGLIQTCVKLKPYLGLNGDYSIQATRYPGNGSRYVRHRDSFTDKANTKSFRKLTLIYYLNEEFEGGQLRVYLDNLKCHNEQKCDYFDVDPKLDTLVLFRSEYVEHEVLPSYKDRYAITVWASASSEHIPSPTGGIILNSMTGGQPLAIQEDISFKFPLNPSRIRRNGDFVVSNKTIFISIANYLDSEGPKTLEDLFRKAKNPERIFVGYVYQGAFHDQVNLLLTQSEMLSKYRENIRLLFIPSEEATGPCLARHLAQKLWRQEDYLLQIDSHMRFRPFWDEYLIELQEKIRAEENCKPVITSYPPSYYLPNHIPDPIQPTVLVPWKFDESGMLRQKAVSLSSDVDNNFIPYYRSPLWAAGFSFSDSSVLLHVPYSNFLPYLFFGEEIIMALRLFTHGYSFFAPGEAVLFHLYSRSHRPTIHAKINEVERLQREQSLDVVRSFFSDGEKPNASLASLNRQFFGIGSDNTKEDFETSIGVSFSRKFIDHEKDWLKFMVPQQYSQFSVVFSKGIFIEDEQVKGLKQDILSLVANSTTDVIPRKEKASNSHVTESILSFISQQNKTIDTSNAEEIEQGIRP